MRLADSFTNVYPVSKTLRFGLVPVGRTQEYIERDGIISTDVARSEDYQKVKKLIDLYHMDFIEQGLTGIDLKGLDEFYSLYSKVKRTEAEEKKFEKAQDNLRKEIVEKLKKETRYKSLFGKELIKKDLPEFLTDEDERKLVEKFSDFTTYFTGFYQNRENMYSTEAKSTAISYRVVHQNLPKYIDNMKVFDSMLHAGLDDKIKELENALRDEYDEIAVADYFDLYGFNKVIPQSGIDLYNTIIGGIAKESGVKIQGLNEYVNLYNQANGTKLPKFKPLFKQILSDRSTFSFVAEQFETDEEVFKAMDYLQDVIDSLIASETDVNISQLLEGIGNCDLSQIYIRNDMNLTSISQEQFGDWSIIKKAISERYDRENPIGKTKPEKYDEKKRKELNGNKNYSISFLNECLEEIGEKPIIEDYFPKLGAAALAAVEEARGVYQSIETGKYQNGFSLKKNDRDISKIKQLLDAYKELQRLIKPLVSGLEESNKDDAFYGELSRIWDELDIVTPMYNKIRNYVTGKPYSIEKVKLNFGNPNLLGGWPVSREIATSGVIFKDSDYYYLGIIAKGKGSYFKSYPVPVNDSDVIEKMVYQQAADPQKDVQNLMVIDGETVKKNGRKEQEGEHSGENLILEELKNRYLPSEINRIRLARSYSTLSDSFNRKDLEFFIAYYQDRVREYYTGFDFVFKDPSAYSNFGDFTDDVNRQAYQVRFDRVSKAYIDSLVNQGCLYLFKIYNKDFSPYSKGTPNLHTLYWKELFAQENLRDVVYKLNGEAEIFYRKASIRMDQAVVHLANEELKNKDPLNEKKTSLFAYDLVKDRRFTCDKYQFHVPITINFTAPGEKRMNSRVNRDIRTAEDVHIIGIDRGERNLLYISVIDMNGNIVEQMSLNQILTYDKSNNLHRRDYHQLLTEREKENVRSRQNWTTTGSIKNLKEGYLSQVIHVIAELMLKYNAIIVLEDLNFGFKQGRQKFERQVYQKFEKMLIDKLNFYVDKKKDPKEPGGVLNGYQLTAQFESFQKLKKQTGFLYYVPAWNTSKIDPTTGFVNLFYTKYESAEKTKAFIKAMDRIHYDEATGCYAFDIDYSKFTYKADGTKTKWVVYSYGTRIDHYRNTEKNSEWDVKYVNVTEKFDALFNLYGIDRREKDLRDAICSVESADFYRAFMKNFALMLQMRNSDENEGIDQMISPVMNAEGKFFVSGTNKTLPLDADANGAYNIAKKGLLLVKKIRECKETEVDKVKLAITNKEWLKFAQENTL